MKQVLQRLLKREEGEKFHAISAVFMILLFLTFWGASFYILLNTFG
jgi:hypothetical protein